MREYVFFPEQGKPWTNMKGRMMDMRNVADVEGGLGGTKKEERKGYTKARHGEQLDMSSSICSRISHYTFEQVCIRE